MQQMKMDLVVKVVLQIVNNVIIMTCNYCVMNVNQQLIKHMLLVLIDYLVNNVDQIVKDVNI